MSRNLAILLAALLLGASVVAAGVLVQRPLTRGVDELAGLRGEIASLEEAVKASAPAAARQAARPNVPDPNQRYEVKTEGSPVLGSPEAVVEIVEFSDFQCPFCSRVTPTLKQVQKDYGDRVRIVFKHLPLGMHPKAPDAHAAAEAAHRQGKFWEMHDAIFANQQQMAPEKYVEYATQLGLDLERFKKDVADPAVRQRVEGDAEEAARLNVRGTPGFFINGRYLSGAQPLSAFKQRIDEELAAKKAGKDVAEG
jgi:protein-disulfide isomerase